ncbi:MAG: ABC transporter ATP-binding protein [Pseudomonadota bacterium]
MNGAVVRAPAISFENLTLGYDQYPVVHHVTGTIDQGALLAIVGSNGSGKSTLLKGLVGELKPVTGRIDLHGTDKRDIAYLPQVIDIDRDFPISVFDCVAMGLWREIGASWGLDAASRERVADALEAVHLTGLESRAVGALSGGQFQRVLFARLLLQDAKIILLDEPFRAVDAKTIDDLIGLIGRWHAEGRTVVAVLHDIDLVRHHFSETLLLAREVLAWGDTDSVLNPVNLDRSRAFSEAADPAARVCDRDDARETA